MCATRQRLLRLASPSMGGERSLLSPFEERYLGLGFRRLLSTEGRLEPHLAGVVDHALSHPGSLLRAKLAFGLASRQGVAPAAARRLAIALEYFHSASLIFDDMPSMDDARQRRGAPCSHRLFGEAAATLGALGLITRAYALVWQCLAGLDEAARREASELVERCLGVDGILNGQAHDVHFDARRQGGAQVLLVAEGKTVTLVRLTLLLPAIVAGVAADTRQDLDRLATVWGLAYQILDDFKDILMPGVESGKSSHRDALLGRPNLPQQRGMQRALADLKELLLEAGELVSQLREVADLGPLLGLQNLLLEEMVKIEARLPRGLKGLPSHVHVAGGGDKGGLAFAEAQLRRWAIQGGGLALTLPAPSAALEVLLQEKAPEAFAWRSRDGEEMVALGHAFRLESRGKRRFVDIRRQSRAIRRRLAMATEGGLPGVLEPRFFGGFSFSHQPSADQQWRGFGAASFSLPRFLYRRHRGGATLSLNLRHDEPSSRRDRHRWLDALGQIWQQLQEARPWSSMGGGVENLERPNELAWRHQVETIRQAIADGTYRKVVAACQCRAELASPLPLAVLFARLTARQPATTQFAVRRGDALFAGATPERLVKRTGRQVCSEALAGSASLADVAGEHGQALAHKLLASSKDRFEHRLVVEAIAERLAPLCQELQVPTAPQVHALRQVQHLRTAISGCLKGSVHALDLVAALHPTPAVGGVPTAAAVGYIDRWEPWRGWYASPVGWFDDHGDGDLVVALRSCLLRRRQPEEAGGVTLFAGAGIVAESQPAAEYAEVQLKMDAALEALRS